MQGDWTEEAELAYSSELVPQINALVLSDPEKFDRIIEATKVPVAEFAKENITISLKGNDLTIAFNARYFTEALRVVSDEFLKETIENDGYKVISID